MELNLESLQKVNLDQKAVNAKLKLGVEKTRGITEFEKGHRE